MQDSKRLESDDVSSSELLPTPSSIDSSPLPQTVEFGSMGDRGEEISEGNSRMKTDETLSSIKQSIRTYELRWFMLALFVLYSMSNAFQWIEYCIVAEQLERFYGVSYTWINWTSVIYMVLYIPLIFPASWLLDKKGLRVAVIVGSFGTALGAWIKCGSASPDHFYVTFIGQTIVAASQIFILGIPPRLAAVWFGPKEVSTACAIGVFGNQLGIALGFLWPSELVPDSDNDAIEHGLKILFYSTAAFCTALLLVVALVFRAAPPSPPSIAAATSAEDNHYGRSIMRLIKNPSYCLLLVSYGINVGVFYAVSVLLEPVFKTYFPGQNDAGRIGLTIVVAGMVGSAISGVWLDKTHKFKETTLALYIFAFFGLILYTFIFRLKLVWPVYLSAGFLGFFMTAYLPVGFEFASEITFPESEGTSAGLLNASAQVFGIIFTNVAAELLHGYSDIVCNLSLCGFLFLGAVMTVFIKAELKRQNAQRYRLSQTVDEEKGNPSINHSIQ